MAAEQGSRRYPTKRACGYVSDAAGITPAGETNFAAVGHTWRYHADRISARRFSGNPGYLHALRSAEIVVGLCAAHQNPAPGQVVGGIVWNLLRSSAGDRFLRAGLF